MPDPRQSPNSAQSAGNTKRRVGLDKDTLLRRTVTFDHADGFHVCAIEVMPIQDLLRHLVLLRRKPKHVLLIVPQKELNDPIAHAAETVIEDDQAATGLYSFRHHSMALPL